MQDTYDRNDYVGNEVHVLLGCFAARLSPNELNDFNLWWNNLYPDLEADRKVWVLRSETIRNNPNASDAELTQHALKWPILEARMLPLIKGWYQTILAQRQAREDALMAEMEDEAEQEANRQSHLTEELPVMDADAYNVTEGDVANEPEHAES